MPEGYEGHQPSPAELGIAAEQLAAAEITQRQLFEKTADGRAIHGLEQTDEYHRVVFRREEYDDGGQQAIQYEFHPDGGVTEHGTMVAGERLGRELQRQHPMAAHDISVRWEDEDLGPRNEKFSAVLEVVGQTVAGAPTSERYARFEITDQTVLEAFADVTPDPKTNCAIIRGRLSDSFVAAVNGRTIQFEPISKISVDVVDGRPTKAIFHTSGWSENKVGPDQK